MIKILCMGDGHPMTDYPWQEGVRICRECHKPFFQEYIFRWLDDVPEAV